MNPSTLLSIGVLASVVGAQSTATTTVRGRVVDVLGDPIPAAEVWVTDADGRRLGAGRAEGTGMFALATIPAATAATLHAAAPGFAPDALPIDGALGAPAGAITLLPAVPLGGRVVDARDQPVAAAIVTVRAEVNHGNRTWVWTGTCRSDGRGAFALPAVPAQSLQVGAWAPGLLPATLRCRPEDRPEVTFALADDLRPRQRIEIRGLPVATRAKVVCDPTTRPGADDPVFPAELLEHAVGEDGVAEICWLPVDHAIAVRAPGYASQPLRVYNDGDQPRPLQFALTPTSTAPPATAVQGKLVDELGKPLGQRTVLCRNPHDRTTLAVTTAADGTFTVAAPVGSGAFCEFGMPPGPMRVGHPRAVPDVGGISWWSTVVEAGGFVVVHARAATTIRGVATSDAGVPLGGAPVELLLQRRVLARTICDGDGAFVFPGLPAGAFSLRVRDHDDRIGTCAARVDDGQVHEIEPFQYPPAGEVTGVVRDEQGRPLAGATVQLVRQQDGRRVPRAFVAHLQPVRTARTDLHGRYRLQGVEPGEAWLGVATSDPTATRQAMTIEAGVTLSADLTGKR